MVVNCLAYIDPGTSNFLFQMLIAGLTTVVFFFSTVKRKVIGFFKKEKPLEVPAKAVDPSTEVRAKSEALNK